MFTFDADFLITKNGCYIYNPTSNRISFFNQVLKKENFKFLERRPRNSNEKNALMYFVENGFVSNNYSKIYKEKVMTFHNDTFLYYDCSLLNKHIDVAMQKLNQCVEPIDYIVVKNFEFLELKSIQTIFSNLKLCSPKIILEINDIEIFKKDEWKWLNGYQEKIFILNDVKDIQDITYTLKNRDCSVMIMANMMPIDDVKNTYFLLSSSGIKVQVCPFNNLHSFDEKSNSKKICEIFEIIKGATFHCDTDKCNNIDFWPIGIPNDDCHTERDIIFSLDSKILISQRSYCNKNKNKCNSLCKKCQYRYICKYKCRILDTEQCFIQKYLDKVL